MQASISAPTIFCVSFFAPPYHNSWARFLCLLLNYLQPTRHYLCTNHLHAPTYLPGPYFPAYLCTSRTYCF
jgi:hypothetical protein